MISKHTMPVTSNPLYYSLTTRFKDRWFTRLVRQARPKRTLDIGCGIGYLLSIIDEFTADSVGIDISRTSLIDARRYTQASLTVADAVRLPFADNVFDCIILADVIEHLPDDRQSLKEIVRVSQPNALLIISTPALEGLLTRTALKHWLHGKMDTHQTDQRNGYTSDILRELCESCGIQVDGHAYTNYYLTELFLGVLKFGFYLKKRRYHSQHDLVDVQSSWLFTLYRRIIFPFIYAIGCAEEFLCRPFLKGHCLIVWGTIKKH